MRLIYHAASLARLLGFITEVFITKFFLLQGENFASLFHQNDKETTLVISKTSWFIKQIKVQTV